jgi:hypothetical protein
MIHAKLNNLAKKVSHSSLDLIFSRSTFAVCTRRITFTISCDFFCKAWPSCSVISNIYLIIHNTNTNSNDVKYLKEVSPSARFAPAVESVARFCRTELTALNMSIRLEIEPR